MACRVCNRVLSCFNSTKRGLFGASLNEIRKSGSPLTPVSRLTYPCPSSSRLRALVAVPSSSTTDHTSWKICGLHILEQSTQQWKSLWSKHCPKTRPGSYIEGGRSRSSRVRSQILSLCSTGFPQETYVLSALSPSQIYFLCLEQCLLIVIFCCARISVFLYVQHAPPSSKNTTQRRLCSGP